MKFNDIVKSLADDFDSKKREKLFDELEKLKTDDTSLLGLQEYIKTNGRDYKKLANIFNKFNDKLDKIEAKSKNKIKSFMRFFENDGSGLSNDEIVDDIYIKRQREEDEQAYLQSYVDMFNDDPNYKKYTAEERYVQICRDFIMTDNMKHKFKELVFKKTYEKVSRIKTYSKMFENVTTEDVQEIVNTLHQISLMFETYHHNTLSSSKHLALDKQHDAYNEIKDDIIEKIIGYTGFRYNKTNVSEVVYSIENLNNFPKFIIDFANKVENFASSNKYPDVENLAQELSGVGAKLTYLLTLNDINESTISVDTLDNWKKMMVDKDSEIYGKK